MIETNNLHLKKYEAGDHVNPFAFDNINMDTIDTAVHAATVSGIGAANESAQGAVHNLVRSASTPFFSFVATANFRAGDSVTVDGVAAAAVLPTGAGLGEGAWVINSRVLCCITGSQLTVYTCGQSTTVDATTLEGHNAAYFGTATAVQEASNAAVAAQTVANAALPKTAIYKVADVWHIDTV